MKKIFTLLTFLFVLTINVKSQSVVVNKMFNGSTPAADVIELIVITNNLDMRGMIIKDYSSSMANDGGGKFTFTSNALWSSVPSGTLITLRNDATFADVTVGSGSNDFLVDVGLTNATYFTASGTLDIATTEMVQIKSSGSGTAGVTGAIHSLAAGAAGTQFTSTANPKIRSTSTIPSTTYAFANNTNSVIGDFDGTDATSSTTAMTFGTGNNAANTTYITNLRNAALPISLVKFTADKLSEKVKLNWLTATEINNDKFVVERSADGENFELVSEVKGAGNSREINSYNVVDATPLKGTSYYRLTQVDYNGASETFAPVAVNMSGKLHLATVQSNTEAGNIDMSIYSPSATSTAIRVMDLSGRTIASQQVNLVEGYQSVNINTNNLSSGIHIIQIMNGEEVVMKKLVL
jgi:hypothetical protein